MIAHQWTSSWPPLGAPEIPLGHGARGRSVQGMQHQVLPALPLRADERATLVAFLEYHRVALIDRASGLSDEQLQLVHPPSSLTLSRLIGHMIVVEQIWIAHRLDAEPESEPYASLDFAADPDAEMTLAQTWTADELIRRFQTMAADSRLRIDRAPSLDALTEGTNADGERWNLRWILVHLIQEYARHCGHADLIREAIDGDLAE